jgi:histidine ammonia-lyase
MWSASRASPARARGSLVASRRLVEQAIASGQTIYGINTGFGKLANVRIAPEKLDRLQVNLIRSHAAGIGAPLPPGVVRAVMLLRANVLLRPTSGVRPELVEALVALLNAGIVPLVPEQGSVGASGDLAPLSHIALALIGEGEVLGEEGADSAARALRAAGLQPFYFAPKEGLSFINGTQAQTALLALLVHDAEVLWRSAVGAAAMSLEALRGTPAPLDSRIHEARPHRGQLEAAALMRRLLADSEIRESHRVDDPRVQDAYSLRCAPQVFGAVADAIRFARETATIELNASTDNPLVFPEGEVISGGNFHGQPVAQALDFLATALTTLQAIAERRVERLVNPDLSQGLPAFLTADPGLSSGFMMVQISAASLVAARHARQHRVDPYRRQPGGLRPDGHGGRVQGPADPGQCPTRGGRGAALRRSGPRVSEAAAARSGGGDTVSEAPRPHSPGRPPRCRPAAGARPGTLGARGGRGRPRSGGLSRRLRLGFLPRPYPSRYLSTAKPLMP